MQTPERVLDNPLAFSELVLGTKVHALQAEFLVAKHPVLIIVGGRRAGKSRAIALLIVWLVARAALDGRPFRILITAPTLDQARVLLGYILDLVRGSTVESLLMREVESPFPQVEFAGGSVIMCRSLAEHAKHVRGHGNFNMLVLDEAGFVPENVVERVLAPLLADRAGSLIMSSTPNTRGSLLERWYLRGLDGKDERIKSFHFPSTSNPFIDQRYIATMRQELPRDVWDVEWEGQWGDSQSSVFRFSDILACTNGMDAPAPDLPRYVIGFDPARLRDASAVVVMETSSTPKRIAHLEDLSGADYTKQVERVSAVANQFGRCKVVVDGTGGGIVVADMLRAASLHVESISFTQAKKQELVANLAVSIEKKAIAFPADRRIVDELRWFRGTRTPSGSMKFEAASGARDDFIMAMCLALAGCGGVVKPPGWPSLGMPMFLRTNDRVTFSADGRALVTRDDAEDGFPAGSWSDWGPWLR